jgi:polyhydroxyalkanoate synthase
MASINSSEHTAPRGELDALASMSDRAMRAYSLLMDPPNVDVGTTPSEVVYREDKLSLLHYLPLREGAVVSPPVLVVYALINKPYILDLQPDRSVVRALLDAGLDVYMIDWGTPTPGDLGLTLGDYVDGYIDRCVDVVARISGAERVNLFGYCMGGTLSVMYAALHPERVRNLIIMAAPVDADTDDGLLHIWSRREWYDADRIVDTLGNVPADFINLGYNILDPLMNNMGKVIHLMDIIDDEEAVLNFFRMERWIGDGIPVAGESFRQFIKDIYQDNLLVMGRMRLDGRRVDLRRIDMPLLLIIGERDHLVPPASTRPLLDAVSSTDKESREIRAGHIGLSVGSRAHRELWPGVAEWLATRSDDPRAPVPRPTKGSRASPDARRTPHESDGVVGLEAVRGIGPAYARRLRAAGVRNAQDLASADLGELSRRTRIPVSRLTALAASTGG